MKTFRIDAVVVILGENASENEALIKDSDPDHIWLHLDKFSSGHVVIQSNVVTQVMLQLAAQKCLQNTKYKNMRNVSIVFTPISNLKCTSKKGEVEFKSNRKTRRFKI